MLVESREARNFGFRISDFGLENPTVMPSANPQSALRNPQSRRAISLTEVLIAMGILTLGLLGVAAIFPVGGWYMQKADIADRGSAIAQSVMSDIVARGMLNPWAWYVMTPAPLINSTSSANYQFQSIDGKYTPSRAPIPYTFTRPFAETLLAGMTNNSDATILTKQFGSAFVIDPMYAAAAAGTTTNGNNVGAYPFPATAYYPWYGSYYQTPAWSAWRTSSKNERTWPIRRVTFQMPNGLPLDKTMAESLCRISDDLAVELPARADRPAGQKWDTITVSGVPFPLARQWTGDYSWIATIVPTTIAARNGMAQNPESFEYEVSVVVFYKRSLPTAPPTTPPELLETSSHERMVNAKIVSTGMSGGELLLTDLKDVTNSGGQNVSPFDQLKVGQWIMLCGPHPNITSTEPRFVLNWYQVLSIDKEGTGLPNFDATRQRVVALRGPEWPWQPATTLTAADLSNDLCVGIFRGAVAVHSKTLRLQSSQDAGMSFFAPPGVTPGNVLH